MEIGPCLRSMRKNKLAVGLLACEIAFAVAVIVNCLGIVAKNRARMTIPTGLDERNMLAISVQSYGEAYDDERFLRQRIEGDLALIRAQPGVIDATVMNPWPLRGGGSSTQMKPVGAPDEALVRCPQYRVDDHFLAALGLELGEGRAFVPADIPPLVDPDAPPESTGPDAPTPPDNVIVTRALADALYPDGALGKQITGAGGSATGSTIVGIVEYMHTPYDQGASGMEYRILFYPRLPGSRNQTGYMVRAEPAAYDALFVDLEERLQAAAGERSVSTQAVMELKRNGQFLEVVVVRILSVIIGLLLFVTALGMFGMTSFAVTKRTRQIGTRRALGATRPAIVRLFLIENGLILLLGATLGLLLAFGINLATVSLGDAIPRMSPGPVLVALLLIVAVGTVATLLPAARAARIPPAIASRAA
jgi:putative ABC transport system permease protein